MLLIYAKDKICSVMIKYSGSVRINKLLELCFNISKKYQAMYLKICSKLQIMSSIPTSKTKNKIYQYWLTSSFSLDSLSTDIFSKEMSTSTEQLTNNFLSWSILSQKHPWLPRNMHQIDTTTSTYLKQVTQILQFSSFVKKF